MKPSKDASRKARTKSVYPDEWTEKVLIGSTQLYNMALHCWARALSDVRNQVEDVFTEYEWRVIYAAVRSADFSTAEYPGFAVAAVLQKPAFHTDATAALADRMRNLGTIRAWYVIWACKFHEAYPDVPEWWRMCKRVPYK